MALQDNGVKSDYMDEDDTPLPCSTGDVHEVESVVTPGYRYLIRPISLHERVRLEAKLAKFSRKLNPLKKWVSILREHEDILHERIKKPVLFEQFISMFLEGKTASYTDIEEAEKERTALSDAIERNRNQPAGLSNEELAKIEEKIKEDIERLKVLDERIQNAPSMNPIAEAQNEYEDEVTRIDKRFSEISEEAEYAQSMYVLTLCEGMLWGVISPEGKRRVDLSPEQRTRVIGALKDSRDTDRIWDVANDLYNLRDVTKKN